MSRVAFVKTAERAAGVCRALELLDVSPVKGRKVFLKPNLNSADPAPGSTHPDSIPPRRQTMHDREHGRPGLALSRPAGGDYRKQ